MKRIFSTIAMAAFAVASFAGGLLTNTNQSASFVRNPARYASLETDAIYFNPAGTAFFKEGWSFSANWQMIWQDRDVLDRTDNDKKYHGSIYVPCMPTLFAAYKTGDWTFSGFFGMPGGGGKAEFNDGLPLFNNIIGGINPVLTGVSEFESTQYMFSLQLGAAYKINDNLSAYAGVRGNYVNNNYNGTIKAIANIPAYGIENMEAVTVDLDLDQSGFAFAPILGLDYKVSDFNFGVKYEFRAVTNIENDTKTLGLTVNPAMADMMGNAGNSLNSYLGGFADGNTLRADAPAILTVGASWQIIPRLQIMGSWQYYFDKDAKVESLMGGDNMMKLSRNTIEYNFGAEFKITEKFLVSAGIQYSNYGINDSYISDLAFINDSFMTGVGGKWSITDKVDFNFGYCYANYAPDNNDIYGTRYERKTHNVSVGVDFRL